jgi:putative endonuclease
MTGKQPKPTRLKYGAHGEDKATEHLQSAGYEILARNYRHDRAEIDIVARDGETVVFVEVKARRSKEFGRPEEAVGDAKRGQIRKAAQGFLLEHNLEDAPCRFDVLAIFNGDINHIRDAFW